MGWGGVGDRSEMVVSLVDVRSGWGGGVVPTLPRAELLPPLGQDVPQVLGWYVALPAGVHPSKGLQKLPGWFLGPAPS